MIKLNVNDHKNSMEAKAQGIGLQVVGIYLNPTIEQPGPLTLMTQVIDENNFQDNENTLAAKLSLEFGCSVNIIVSHKVKEFYDEVVQCHTIDWKDFDRMIDVESIENYTKKELLMLKRSAALYDRMITERQKSTSVEEPNLYYTDSLLLAKNASTTDLPNMKLTEKLTDDILLMSQKDVPAFKLLLKEILLQLSQPQLDKLQSTLKHKSDELEMSDTKDFKFPRIERT